MNRWSDDDTQELPPVQAVAEVIDHPRRSELEARAIEGEVVEQAPRRGELVRQPAREAVERWKDYGRLTVSAGRVVKRAATHDRTQTVVRGAGRVLVGDEWAGIRALVKDGRRIYGLGRYDDWAEEARKRGDEEMAQRWVLEKERAADRRADRKAARSARRWTWVKRGIPMLTALLLLVGVARWSESGEFAAMWAPWEWLFAAIAAVTGFLAATWLVLLVALIVGGWEFLRRVGRRHGQTPSWCAAPPAMAEPGSTAHVDESMVMHALRNLGHGALNKAFAGGWGQPGAVNPWYQPPTPIDHGWEFALRLPAGVTINDIRKRKQTFAHNMSRRAEEVWIETHPRDPAVMSCAVLDAGSLREPVPPYPLLEDGTADFFGELPCGIDARWRPVSTEMMAKNFNFAGIMGSGKSSATNALAAGCALDPVVEIDVFCFAENNDYAWLTDIPGCSVTMGDTAENVAALQEHLSWLYDDMTRRGIRLKELDEDFLTRRAVEQDPSLAPRLIIVDECQAFFRQSKPEDRKAVVDDLIRFVMAARKYGLVLVLSTPSPSDASLPRDFVAVTNRAGCFAISDKTRNNIVLGDRAHENGLSALGLRLPEDAGTSITRGFLKEDGPLRWYYLNSEDRKRIAERAKVLRGERPEANVDSPERRDFLADAVTAVDSAEIANGADFPTAAAVAAELGRLWPQRYGKSKRGDVVDAFAEAGYRIPSTGNRYWIDPAEARAALARRDAATDGAS